MPGENNIHFIRPLKHRINSTQFQITFLLQVPTGGNQGGGLCLLGVVRRLNWVLLDLQPGSFPTVDTKFCSFTKEYNG